MILIFPYNTPTTETLFATNTVHMQWMYICNYVSFFVGLGKTAMHTSSQDVPGTLADTGHDQIERGIPVLR